MRSNRRTLPLALLLALAFAASARAADVYSSEEPQAAYHARIAFCMDIHNEVRQRGGGCAGWGACVRTCVRACECCARALLRLHRHPPSRTRAPPLFP